MASRTFTWDAGDGTSAADWTSSANWTGVGSGYPGDSVGVNVDTVIIPSGKHKCYVNAAITCYDVTLTGDAADTVLELQANLEVTHDLLITSGIMNLGAGAYTLTVGGDIYLTPVGAGTGTNATLTCGDADITVTGKLNTAGVWHSGAYNPKSIFTGGTGDHTFASMHLLAGTDVVLSSGVTEITGNIASAAFRPDVNTTYNTYSNGSGTVKFTSASAQNMYSPGAAASAYKQFYNLILEKTSSTLQCLSTVGFDIRVENNLTITSGILNTNTTTGVNHDLTVGTLGAAGQTGVIVDGTLTLNGSTCILTNLAGTGTLNAPTTTITIRDRAEAGTYAGKAIDVDNMTVNNDLKIELTSAKAQDLDIGDDKIHDLTINNDTDARQNYLLANGSIDGDLTITRGIFNTFNRELTVDGDCSIAADGTLEANVNGPQAVTLGSLTIASGGIYNATSATTTITGTSDADWNWTNNGTFTHNKGKVKFFTDSTSMEMWISSGDTFYDLETDSADSGGVYYLNNIIYGDLTVTDGPFHAYTTSATLTVHGNTYIKSEGQLINGAAQSGTVTFHGLVTNEGTFHSGSGTNILNGGVRNLATMASDDTLTIGGTGGILEGNLDDAIINVNLDPALLIDAAEDKITTGNLGSLGQATSISSFAWVKFAVTPSTSQYIWSTGYNPCNFYMGGTNKLGFQGKRGDTDAVVSVVMSGTYAFTLNTWYHIGFSYDNSSRAILFYINGVEYAGGTFPAALKDVNTDLLLGNYGAGTNMLSGNLADVKIFNTVVNEAGAKILASKINQDPTTTAYNANVIGWWKINEGSASIADFTNETNGGTDHDGTLANGSWENDVFSVNVQDSYDGSDAATRTQTDGAVTVTQGKLEGLALSSADFDGSADYFTQSWDSSFNEPKTIAFWARPDAIQTGANNVISGGSDDYEIYFHSSTNTWWNYYGTKYSVGADGPAVTLNQWQHIVSTIDDTTSPPTHRWYKDGVLFHTGQLNGTPSYGDGGTLDLGRDSSEDNDYYDGDLKDMRLYDYRLSDEQVASLYSNTLPTTPLQWWKLDEGSGNAINSGTSGLGVMSEAGSCGRTNGTLDLDGTLTIDATGTLSAPRGDLSLAAATTFAANTFTHNNGRVVVTNAGVVEYNFSSDYAGSDNPLYDFQNQAAGQVRFTTGYIIENSHSFSGGNNYNYLTGGRQYNYGTTSSAAAITALLRVALSGGDNIAHVYGVSSLYPVTMNNWDDLPMSYDVTIKNMNITTDVTSNSIPSGRTVTLDGDCEFDAFTVEAGGTLDLNGQRAEFSGNLDMESGVTFVGSGALLICNDKIKTDGATVYNSGTSVICGHAGTSTIRFSEGDWENMMYNPTGGGVCFDTNANVANNLIVAGGYYDMQAVHLSGDGVGTLQIVGGGEFRGGDGVTHTITDTFNMAGGLLGTSALDLNGSSESAANASATTWGFGSTFSIEFWFKTSFNGSSTLLDMAESSGNGNRIQVLQTPSEMAFKLYNAGGSSYQIGTTAFTINPDDGKWHHLAFTTDGSTQKIYYDGRLAGEASHTITRDTDPTTKLTVGMHATLGGNYFGKMDELRFFSDVRTVGELRTDMFQGGTLTDSGALVARYKFDEGYDTTLASTVGAPARNLTASGDGVWIAPGTYTYDTSTLKFDKAGACNLIGHQDATATQLHSIHITSGTTVTANCRDNDLVMNSGSLMTNSGSLLSNRNWQYKSRNLPIVGPNSDLKVSTNIWYYMSDGSGLPVSGAGTNYYQLRPSTEVWMQGDFDCQNGLLQSGGDLHLNGHTCSTSKIWNYGGGNIHAEPGSSIVFDNADGFNTSYGENPTTMFFVASGEAAYQATTDAAGANTEGVYTNTEVVTSGTSQMSVSYWVQIPSDSNFWDTSLLRCVWGFGGIFTGTPTVASHPGMWGHTIQSSWIKNDFYSYDNPADADSDFNRLHENATRPINWTGTGPYGWHHVCTTVAAGTGTDKLITYVDGVEVDKRDKPKEFLIVGNGNPGLSIHGAHLDNSKSSYGTQMSLADFRIYKDITLTSGNTVTLASENPATSVSGAYADPTNTLGATLWWKLNDNNGILDTTDSAGTNNGTGYGGAKSGFVTISGSVTPYNPINNLYPAGVTLQNTYISGSKDIIVGQRKENSAGFMAVPSQPFTTKGTVVLD